MGIPVVFARLAIPTFLSLALPSSSSKGWNETVPLSTVVHPQWAEQAYSIVHFILATRLNRRQLILRKTSLIPSGVLRSPSTQKPLFS
jgi:hypothetical protein